jgi:Fic family protein
MAEHDNGAHASAQLAAVDALYRPFPDFAGWARLGPNQRDLWARFAAQLDERQRAATGDQLQRAVTVAMRAAAIDTGAIEGLYQVDRGFTLSVALQRFTWEHELAERGERVRELFLAQLAGYELTLDAATRRLPLSEAWLRSLHEQITAPQVTYRVITELGFQEQELPKGRYKQLPNHVRLHDGSYHAYAPVAAVAPEMHRVLEQLRSPAFEAAHPVEQAAYAHYALTAVHPFADGNGRVARALASVYLYRNLSIPLVVYANQRLAYFDALAMADEGEPRPWLDFVVSRGIDTMQLVEETLRTAAAPQPDEVAELRATLTLASAVRLENLALRLLRESQTLWERTLAAVRPSLDSVVVHDELSKQPAPQGYRRAAAPAIGICIRISQPSSFETSVTLRVNVATDDANPFRFQLEKVFSQDLLAVREADLAPELTEHLELRLDQWMARQLAALLTEIERQISSELAEHRLLEGQGG